MPRPVLGVDACKTGWLGITLDGEHVTAFFGRSIVELVATVESLVKPVVVAIDIPIGLPESSRRRADVEARRIIGARWPSVFMTPTRAALESGSHAAAVSLNKRLAGEGVSVQAYGLRNRIFEVDAWVRRGTHRVIEIHPEVSFAIMAGAPLADSKSTWAGLEHRRRLLSDAGIHLPGDIGYPGTVARADDVLDAAVAAWSAHRAASGEAISTPHPPETFGDGLPSAIWA